MCIYVCRPPSNIDRFISESSFRLHGLRVWEIFTAKLPVVLHVARAFGKTSFFPQDKKEYLPNTSLAFGAKRQLCKAVKIFPILSHEKLN